MTNYELVIFHKITKNKTWLRHNDDNNTPIGTRAAQISSRYPWVKVAVMYCGKVNTIWENGKCVWDEWDEWGKIFEDENKDED